MIGSTMGLAQRLFSMMHVQRINSAILGSTTASICAVAPSGAAQSREKLAMAQCLRSRQRVQSNVLTQ